jgi:hypothetical protein
MSHAATRPVSSLARCLGVMAVVTQQFLVARFVAATQVQRLDMVNNITEHPEQPLALALLTQPMVPRLDGSTILDPCITSLPLNNPRLSGKGANTWAAEHLHP